MRAGVDGGDGGDPPRGGPRRERSAASADRGVSTLLALASALARTDSVEDVALAVRDVVREALGARFVSVSMIDGPWLLTPALGQLDDDTEQRNLRLPLDLDTPAHRVARSGRALVFDDLASLVALFPQAREELQRNGLHSGVVLPLTISGGFRIGSATIAWDREHRSARTRSRW